MGCNCGNSYRTNNLNGLGKITEMPGESTASMINQSQTNTKNAYINNDITKMNPDRLKAQQVSPRQQCIEGANGKTQWKPKPGSTNPDWEGECVPYESNTTAVVVGVGAVALLAFLLLA